MPVEIAQSHSFIHNGEKGGFIQKLSPVFMGTEWPQTFTFKFYI